MGCCTRAAERTAAINTIAGEAYQGAGGADIAAVTANLLSRRLANYGGNTNLIDIVKDESHYFIPQIKTKILNKSLYK